jgi:hypothetical protein
MNKNRRDKKLLRTAAESLRDELRAVCAGTAISPVSRLKIKTNYVGGWYCVVAGLGRAQPRIEIWLDHYPSRKSRHFYYGFYCPRRAPIKRLIRTAPSYLKPNKKLFNDDFEKVKSGFWSLKHSFDLRDYAARYYEEYYGTYCFFGIYDSQKADKPKAVRSIVRKAVNFFQEILNNSSKELSVAVNSDFPRIENRQIVRTHCLRERSSALSRMCKARDDFRCQVCGMKFEEVYGELGEEFAEAHHLKPLSQLSGKVETKPKDLATVCANCHRMLHRMDGKPKDLERLRAVFLKNNKRNRR